VFFFFFGKNKRKKHQKRKTPKGKTPKKEFAKKLNYTKKGAVRHTQIKNMCSTHSCK
jgi:hypothetical protein